MAYNNFRTNTRSPGSRPILTVGQAAKMSSIAKKSAMTILGSMEDQAKDMFGISKDTQFFTLRRSSFNGHLYASNPTVVVNEGDYGKSYAVIVADVNRKTIGKKLASQSWLRPYQRDTYGLKDDALKAAKIKNDEIMQSFCEALAEVGPDAQLEFSGFQYYTMLVVDGGVEHTMLVAEVHSVLGNGIVWTSRVSPEEADEANGEEDEDDESDSDA